MGLDSLYLITQVASIFDLHTHTYTLAHTHVHIVHVPKMRPGRMDVQAQPHPLMAYWARATSLFFSSLTVNLLSGTPLSFSVSSMQKGPLNPLANIKPHKGIIWDLDSSLETMSNIGKTDLPHVK